MYLASTQQLTMSKKYLLQLHTRTLTSTTMLSENHLCHQHDYTDKKKEMETEVLSICVKNVV